MYKLIIQDFTTAVIHGSISLPKSNAVLTTPIGLNVSKEHISDAVKSFRFLNNTKGILEWNNDHVFIVPLSSSGTIDFCYNLPLSSCNLCHQIFIKNNEAVIDTCLRFVSPLSAKNVTLNVQWEKNTFPNQLELKSGNEYLIPIVKKTYECYNICQYNPNFSSPYPKMGVVIKGILLDSKNLSLFVDGIDKSKSIDCFSVGGTATKIFYETLNCSSIHFSSTPLSVLITSLSLKKELISYEVNLSTSSHYYSNYGVYSSHANLTIHHKREIHGSTITVEHYKLIDENTIEYTNRNLLDLVVYENKIEKTSFYISNVNRFFDHTYYEQFKTLISSLNKDLSENFKLYDKLKEKIKNLLFQNESIRHMQARLTEHINMKVGGDNHIKSWKQQIYESEEIHKNNQLEIDKINNEINQYKNKIFSLLISSNISYSLPKV
jgi:uncharacterized protein YoxC